MQGVAASRTEALAALLVLAVLALLPIGRSAELPIAIGALCGLVMIARRRIDWHAHGAARLALMLFACYWLPALFSLAGAVAPEKSASTVASMLRFLPFACFVGVALGAPATWPRSVVAVAAISALWLLDAWVQYTTGFGIAGAPEIERLSGIFGADNLKFGPVLATLSPFVLLVARDLGGRTGLLLAFLLVLVPILLSGSRAAWLSYAVVCVIFAWREAGSLRRFAPLLIGIAIAIGAALVGVERVSPALQARLDRSLLALAGTEQAIDEASAGRLTIWRTSVAMIEAHPLTGVGVRGYRHDYIAHAGPGDRFAPTGAREGAAHPHQIVLEVLSETGWIGLLFWILGSVVAVHAWWRAGSERRARAFAPAVALIAMCFPLNSHFAFYSAWWGLLFWWLLALYCAAIGERRDEQRSAFSA